MRQLKLCFLLIALLMGGAIQVSAVQQQPFSWNESDKTFYLNNSDGLETYTVEGSITFKGKKGGSIPSWRDCGVVFVPKNEGDKIMITVNSCSLAGENYLLLYDGAIEKIANNVSDGKDQSKYLPTGWLKKLQNDADGYTYTSQSDDGKVSFGFHSKDPQNQAFDITVTSITPKEMTFGSATALTDVQDIYRGAKDQIIFGVNVKTEGALNALTMDELTISTNVLNGNNMLSNLRLYKGKKFSADNLLASDNAGDALTATNVTLKGGNNYFYVAADISNDAKGTIPGLEVTSLKVGNQVHTLIATKGNDVKIQNIILMPAESKTYIIDNEAEFYDDGGKDNKISENFTGSVTFVPATAGHAIKIDFSKLAIFNTSNIGKNDVLKFYNGRVADESQLITTLLKEAETVKSSAGDGSMTVTLKSITGVPAEGWEAIVSQFLPGDMTFSKLTSTPVGDATVSAGEKQVQMLVFDVVTDNTASPLKVTNVALSTPDAKNLAKAQVYYLGKKNVFSTSKTFGETAVNGNNINVAGEQQLIEGHNYFAVVLDLNDKAKNGETISLTLNNVTVGATVQATNPVPATRTVDNVARATKGTHTYTISEPWKFTHTPSPYNPNKYEAEDADYIVTFIPAEAGFMAQIDFSKFDVTYSDNTWGTKAVYEIYSGETCQQANLLWKLNNKNDATKGPGKTLRSAADNGAITIKFNPKTTQSYYAASGWLGTVTPFKNHEMAISDIEVKQSSTDILPAGAMNAEIIDFKVLTEGNLTKTKIKEIALDLKGCQEQLSKVNVLFGTSADKAAATKFGSVENPATSAIIVTGECELTEGANYFWVTADVKNDAAAESKIDAKLISLKDAGNIVISTTNGDPEGERTVKYILNMPADTTVVTVTNPLMFYDDGGENGDETPKFKGVVIFKSGKAGHAVKIDTKSFSVGNGKLYLYDGSEVNDANLVDSYSYTSSPKTYISKAEDGSLTVKFESTTSTYSKYAGFAIDVSLHELKPFGIESSVTEAAVTTPVVRGTTNGQMQKLVVTVNGDRGSLKLNNIKFNTTGTTDMGNIKNAKLYFTGHTNTFSDKDLVASVANVTTEPNMLSATHAVEIAENGQFYFWLTYEIDNKATAGNKVVAKIESVDVDGNPIAVSGDATEREIKAGLAGNFTIGASNSAHYKTFAEASAALAGGIEGAVNFTVEPGVYKENVIISHVDGVSAEHSITFRGQTTNVADVKIIGKGFSDPAYGQFKSGMFLIDSTSYVTLTNMTFAPTDQSYPAVIHVYNQSRHVTLDSISVIANSVTASSGASGISLVRMDNQRAEGKYNDFLTVQNSSFSGGYIALYLGSNGNVKHTAEEGLVVKNNVINEAGSKGIYVTMENNVLIDNNVINQSGTQKTDYHGIDLNRVRGKSVVSNNRIVNSHSAYSCGIELRGESFGSDNEPVLVYNNSISITNSPNTSTTGIEIDGDNKNIHLYYNTVRIAGDKGYAFYTARARSNPMYTNIKLQNNLLQNLSGSDCMFIHNDYKEKALFSHNAFYAQNGKVCNEMDFEAFKALNGVENCMLDTAEFISETDLQLKKAGKLNAALPVAFITTDLKGVTRHATTPTIGAYEYKNVVIEDPKIAQGYPMMSNITETSAIAKTKWNVSGKLYSKVEKLVPGIPAPARMRTVLPMEAPTVADLLNGTPADYAAGEEHSTNFDGLNPATQYKAYFVLVSALDGTQSEVIESEVFTTQAHIDALKIELNKPYATIAMGDNCNITPVVTGGTAPYTYEWRNQMNEVVGHDATLAVTPAYTYGYKLSVTSADGQTAVAKTAVHVLGEAVTATFDDNYLDSDSFFKGDYANDVFYSGSYAFQVSNNGGWWSGYALSNQTSTAFKNQNDQFHSASGGAYKGSPNFCVAYPWTMGYGEDAKISVTNATEGEVLKGVFVNNSAWTIHSMTVGDQFAKPFTQGSWFKITAHGTASDGSTKSTDFYLGDFRSTNPAEHYMVKDWTWWDLSPLGKVVTVTFSFAGSDTGKNGLNTPAYACFDNFNIADPNLTGTNEIGNNKAMISVNGNTIQVSGATHVAVYTMTGAQVSAGHAKVDVVPGVYIVVADGQSHKVMVK